MEELFRRDGYVVVPGVLGSEDLEVARRHLNGFAVPANGQVAVSIDHDPVAAGIAAHPLLVGLARRLLAADCEVFGFTYLVKPPRSPLVVLWHQDGHPWRARGIHEALTVWVAVDGAGPASGGLRVIPGSHRMEVRALGPNTSVESMFGWESPAEMVDETAAVDIVLEPGDVSVHDPALLHSSGSNRTEHRRAGLGLRYRALS